MSTLTIALQTVCDVYAVERKHVMSNSKDRRVTRARQCLAWLLRTVADMSQEEIGKHLDRDHTTVLHAVRVVEAWEGDLLDHRRAARNLMAARMPRGGPAKTLEERLQELENRVSYLEALVLDRGAS